MLIKTDAIIELLRKAAAIKDVVEPICQKKITYQGKDYGYAMCVKCYPIQPERSKREDLDCKNCDKVFAKVPNGCYIGCFKKLEPYLDKSKMRCSEHCGNTVRDK